MEQITTLGQQEQKFVNDKEHAPKQIVTTIAEVYAHRSQQNNILQAQADYEKKALKSNLGKDLEYGKAGFITGLKEGFEALTDTTELQQAGVILQYKNGEITAYEANRKIAEIEAVKKDANVVKNIMEKPLDRSGFSYSLGLGGSTTALPLVTGFAGSRVGTVGALVGAGPSETCCHSSCPAM